MKANQAQKYAKYTIPKLIARAAIIFNKYIRERDKQGEYYTCCSCGRTKKIQGKDYQAGHYYPAGQNAWSRFAEWNVNGQCMQCNYFKGSNSILYRKFLVDKYGEEFMKNREMEESYWKARQWKWDRFALIEIIEWYKQELKK